MLNMDIHIDAQKYIIILICVHTIFGAELCSKSMTVGDTNFKKHSDHLDDLSGIMYLVTSDMYRFSCCGLIHAVKSNTRINGDVRFLVLRPTDNKDQYLIAGDFKIDVTTAPKAGAVVPSGSMQLQVQDGDRIGWYVPGKSSIPYTNGKIDGQVYLLSITEDPALGDVIDFGEAKKKSKRIYAIAASMDEDDNTPAFKGMSPEVTISADSEIGATVTKIKVFDPQLQDTVVTLSDNPYFEVSTDGRSLILKATPPADVYELVLTSNSICGLSASINLVITVIEAAVDPPPPPSTTPLAPPLPTTTTTPTTPTTSITTTTTQTTPPTTTAVTTPITTPTSPPPTTTTTSAATAQTTTPQATSPPTIPPPQTLTTAIPTTSPTEGTETQTVAPTEKSPVATEIYDNTDNDESDVNPTFDELSVNGTKDEFIISPQESQTSLWMIFAGLSASTVLLACNVLIFRYAWKLYGGKFRPKTASEVEKGAIPTTPDTDKEPEVVTERNRQLSPVKESEHSVHTEDDGHVKTDEGETKPIGD